MHDWVVAAQHKLILFSANGVGKSEAVSYSGPTRNANRSGKHSHLLPTHKHLVLR